MDSQQPQTNKTTEPYHHQPQPQPPRVLGWAKRAGRTCLQRLERPGTAGPLLFTCLCLALAYKNRSKIWHLRLRAAPAMAATEKRKRMLMRSVSMATLHGGYLALQRLMDSQGMRVDETGVLDDVKHFEQLLRQEKFDFKELQRIAGKLEMSGLENKAVEMLKATLGKCRDKNMTHETYELEMLLVEMLIYKGAYPEALNLQCLYDKEISDARAPLYKAIIHCIHGNNDKAIECYKEFQDIRNRFHWPEGIKEDSYLYAVIHNYETFERIVLNLRREIEIAHKAQQTDKAE